MKKLILVIAMFCAVGVMAPSVSYAQTSQKTNVGQALTGLINVNVGAITVGDITLEDLVDVQNVLNNNKIDILRNAIQNNPIASNNQNVLNNLLRNANLITGNQVVVGVLSGGILLIDTLTAP